MSELINIVHKIKYYKNNSVIFTKLIIVKDKYNVFDYTPLLKKNKLQPKSRLIFYFFERFAKQGMCHLVCNHN
jgi:hypothetical protein